MRGFDGLENGSDDAKQAMLKFTYLSATGNMDEAFKAIKLIKKYAHQIFSQVYPIFYVSSLNSEPVG